MIILMIAAVMIVVVLVRAVYLHRTYGLSIAKWHRLSKPSRKILTENKSLPKDWRQNTSNLYRAVSGLDNYLTVPNVNRAYRSYDIMGDAMFDWTQGNKYRGTPLGKYHDMHCGLSEIKRNLEGYETLARESAWSHAVDVASEVLTDISTDKKLITSTINTFKELA